MLHNSAFIDLVSDAKNRINETDVHKVKQWIDERLSFILIDVREESEWMQGHLPGAVYMGKGIIERDIEIRCPDKNTVLVLYCGGGLRSALAADNLQKMGYRDVLNMDGGISAWINAGYPFET